MEITLNISDDLDPIAVYAALVATAVLIFNVVKWLRSGPRLMIRANPNTMFFNDPDPQREGKTFIFVKVANVGSTPTTITAFGLAHFRNRWDQLLKKPDKLFAIVVPQAAQHLPLPHVLKVGEEWLGIIEQTPEIDQLAKNGLLYADISQSVTSSPARARITIPDT